MSNNCCRSGQDTWPRPCAAHPDARDRAPHGPVSTTRLDAMWALPTASKEQQP